MSSTASTIAARQHARAQEAAAVIAEPKLPEGVSATDITFAQRIPSGGYANVVLGRGTRVRFSDPLGSACAHLLLLRAEAPWERLNFADSVKVPWQAYLGAGHPLLSDQGRVLATLLCDTSAHHDALCGPGSEARAALLLAGAKQGLAAREVGPTVSFFRGVRVASDGGLLPTGGAGAGGAVELLIHLPVTLLIANAEHPLDPTPPTDLDVIAWRSPQDLSALHNTEPEYRRAVQNTERTWRAARTDSAAATLETIA